MARQGWHNKEETAYQQMACLLQENFRQEASPTPRQGPWATLSMQQDTAEKDIGLHAY